MHTENYMLFLRKMTTVGVRGRRLRLVGTKFNLLSSRQRKMTQSTHCMYSCAFFELWLKCVYFGEEADY